MAENSKIGWTHHTFNPWMGCTKVSAGCANCYAEMLVTRRMGHDVWGPDKTRKRTAESTWKHPMKWAKQCYAAGFRARVFCGSLCDVFEDHPVANDVRNDLFYLISATPSLDWLLLTKRPERIKECLPTHWGHGWENVWLGTSVENNDVAERAQHLRQVPAVVRFISYEPALGPIDKVQLHGIDWVIAGGESGRGFRPMDIGWALDVERRCLATRTAFFFKQIAAPKPGQPHPGLQFHNQFPTPRPGSEPNPYYDHFVGDEP